MKERMISLSEIIRYFPLEFQISGKPWHYYDFEKGVFPDADNINLPNYQIIRLLVKRMTERRDFRFISHQPVRAGHLNAVGLIDEIFRYVLNAYRITKNPPAFGNGLNWSKEKIEAKDLNETLNTFVKEFPPYTVLRKKEPIEKYIKDKTREVQNEEIITKELILLYLANNNPAFAPFMELFSDSSLSKKTVYKDLFNSLDGYFKTQPGYGPNNKPLIDLLREPILASPYSLIGQLMYIKDNWKSIIPDELLYRILMAVDIIKEEEKLGWLGQGPNLVMQFKGLGAEDYQEYERFTKDKDWMAKVVLIAKSTYVWLDQLSKKYKRWINKIDQIPDEELDQLARWGFTGLWLIGIWERSPASQTIKQICGNPEAVASAYSLYDYRISEDLGGEQAFQNLKHRAWAKGIRLGTDVVPNHMGIYSKLVIEHPDWFIQLDCPPFPSYSFNGPDLSHDPRVGLYIEDRYWTRNDAAVVFKRLDKWTGTTKYIYHGNDGTSMPWNDTAQLNFLIPEVREAVIQNILSVARKFSIIRFDAAMTLTKKHYQRLWFPHPGTGGGIPSRAERGMLKSDFDKLMPNEFWREVVDRINAEIPETLLLAEAFWLMEGFFVRTLGMHRVYNSAFMNMLKMEENEKYRSVIKNVLEFNPEILKRFVNFMNNPDEQTAIAQFGKGDKYFGVCLMMVTIPGLPMFGHGQIEGFTEKYGMEYKKAYWNEEADWGIVRRHEAEIFPLMRRRHLFSGVENFVLYDFYGSGGSVNENVFAYSNMCGGERAVIVYHNRYENTGGWIRTSCAISVPTDKPGQRRLTQKTLGEGLRIRTDGNYYYIFRDQKTGLEYIRHGRELADRGLYVELGAYQYYIFIDFREVQDGPKGYYSRIAGFLNGRGVHSIELILKEMILSPIHAPFRELISDDMFHKIIKDKIDDSAIKYYSSKTEEFLKAIKDYTGSLCDETNIAGDVINKLKSVLKIKTIREKAASVDYLTKPMADINLWRIPFIWLSTHNLGKVRTKAGYESQSSSLFDELLLGKIILGTFKHIEHDEWSGAQKTTLIKIMTGYHNWYNPDSKKDMLITVKNMIRDYDVQLYLNFNQHDGIMWYSKEKMESLLYWLLHVSVVLIFIEKKNAKRIIDEINKRYQVISEILQISAQSEYKAEELISRLNSSFGTPEQQQQQG